MKSMNKFGGAFLVAISAASFGLMPVFAKVAYTADTSTITLLFLRFSVAAIFMFLLIFIKKLAFPSTKEVLILLLMGAIGYAGQSFCYFMALNFASASVVSLLLYTYPVMVMIGSALFLKEKITFRKILALVFALTGAVVIIGTKGHAKSIGIILAVASAIIYSAYILISSKVIKAGMEVQSSTFIMLGAAIVYGIMNLISGFSAPENIKGISAVVMIALISTVLAFWSFFTGLEKIGPTLTSLVSILEPVVTVFSSILILSEKVTVNIIIGGILVMVSLLVILIPKSKNNKAKTSDV